MGRAPILVRDQQTTRKGADRALHHGDVLIREQAEDAGPLQHGLGKAEHHRIVAAQNLTHGLDDRPGRATKS